LFGEVTGSLLTRISEIVQRPASTPVHHEPVESLALLAPAGRAWTPVATWLVEWRKLST
jgi:hypothetical protein